MKLRQPLLLLVATVPGCVADPIGLGPNTPQAYVEALAAAHAFLDAWVTRDGDHGIKLMTISLRRPPLGSDPKDYETWLRLYMVGLSTPHHAAFELGRGTLQNSRRAVFPVTLYEAVAEGPAFGYSSSMELVREEDTWRVAVLPRSSDNYEF